MSIAVQICSLHADESWNIRAVGDCVHRAKGAFFILGGQPSRVKDSCPIRIAIPCWGFWVKLSTANCTSCGYNCSLSTFCIAGSFSTTVKPTILLSIIWRPNTCHRKILVYVNFFCPWILLLHDNTPLEFFIRPCHCRGYFSWGVTMRAALKKCQICFLKFILSLFEPFWDSEWDYGGS